MASETVRRVKDAIQYHDDESLQEFLDKIKERPRIDAEFDEKITTLQRIRDTENYAAFHDVVDKGLKQLTDAQKIAKKSKTTLCRPIEILEEVLPVFEKACSIYTEKFESSPKVNQILKQLDADRLELTKYEGIEDGDVEKVEKLERKCEKMLEEAVKQSIEDVERVNVKIRETEQAGNLTWLIESTRKAVNERSNFLIYDFEQMKNSCCDDIELIAKTLEIEIVIKEQEGEEFETKDKELEESIGVKLEKEEELRRNLEIVREHRKSLEEDCELRRATLDNVDVASEAFKGERGAIQYHEDEALQEAMDKMKEWPRIDAEFEEKITILQKIKDTEIYVAFHDVVDKELKQLTDLQERAKKIKTYLSRPIQNLNEFLPVFKKACSVYTEKVESSHKVNQIFKQLVADRLELKRYEGIEVENVEKPKKLDWKCVNMLAQTLQKASWSKERTSKKFETKGKELEESIGVVLKKEEELRRKLEIVREHRRTLEEDRELKRAIKDKADVVHKQAVEELQELITNVNDLSGRVVPVIVVLEQTRDVCKMLLSKAVESKNMQNQELKNILSRTKENKHNALIAQGVNYLNIKEREIFTIEILNDKINKKKTKLKLSLRHHLESDVKKVTEKIKHMTSNLEASKKTLSRVNEKLDTLRQDIAEVQRELQKAGTSYMSLDEAYKNIKMT